jgi:RNA polymerase sigma-70 factor (ECF subfamily)
MPIRSYELDLEAVDERLAATDLREELGTALESLPEAQRAALELRVLEERPYQEIASALSCTETAARIRVMRALGRLARLLGPSGA